MDSENIMVRGLLDPVSDSLAPKAMAFAPVVKDAEHESNSTYRSVAALCFMLLVIGSLFILQPTLAVYLNQLGLLDVINLKPTSVVQSAPPLVFGFGLKSILIAIHLAGLVIGFGAALFLDLYLMRYLWREKIDPQVPNLARFGANVVTTGLSLLWISGIGFLVYYYFYDPSTLATPKIWVKLSVVAILSINGIAIHKLVLRKLDHKRGSKLFVNESYFAKQLALFLGAVSATSWGFAMLLGIFREINTMFGGPALFGMYLAALFIAYCAINTIAAWQKAISV